MPASATLYRSFTAAVRQLGRLQRALAEIPLALHGPALERLANEIHYAASPLYASDAHAAAGLFPFEERALRRFFPAPPARLLLHGAGGGRELLALAGRGFQVVAYEPIAALARAATRRLGPAVPAVACAGVQEWAARDDGPFDGVFTGWGTWSHLLRHGERVAALRAFRRACPHGPVLVSFWSADPAFDHRETTRALEPLHPEPQGALERLTRDLVRRRLLRLPPLERGTAWSRGNYFHRTGEAELREEASLAGYGVAYYERDASRYPHAVLRPV